MKKQRWEKKGLILKASNGPKWMVSHLMVPTVEQIKGDLCRIYFCGRDPQNRSLIGYAEVDMKDPSKVVRFSKKPVLGLGPLGQFDDNGVTPSWIVNDKGKKYLYYIGWNKGLTVRMHLAAGLAVSEDDGLSFKRVVNVPILDRIHTEPLILNTAPCVLKEKGCWRMWYVSGIRWINKDLPEYNIKYAESKDGIVWNRRGVVCIDFKSSGEHALARPCVLKEDGIYKMWYSYKGRNYRIGYAESLDGISWQRKDDAIDLDVSKKGWDSEMIEYAFVFNQGGVKHMFYNGNNYGEEGIGWAICQDEKRG